MRYDKLTIKAQEAIQSAESYAHQYNHTALDGGHLLLALTSQRDGVIPPLFDRLGIQRAQVEKELEKVLKSKDIKDDIGEITKTVIKRLYKDLSYHHPYIIDRIKV